MNGPGYEVALINQAFTSDVWKRNCIYLVCRHLSLRLTELNMFIRL